MHGIRKAYRIAPGDIGRVSRRLPEAYATIGRA